MTFHDGTPFNAEIAKWNLDRKINEKLPLADQIPFESITALDETTLEIKLTRPYPPIYGYLSTKTFSMYSPKFVEEVGADGLKNGAVGTGPFIVSEYVPNEKLILVKNRRLLAGRVALPGWDRYHGCPGCQYPCHHAGSPGRHISPMIFPSRTPTASSSMMRLKVWSAPSSRYYYVSLTTLHEPLTEKLVRQAFNYAVDKDAMVKAIYLNYVTPAKAHIVTEIITGFKANELYPYDPEKAKVLDG